MKEHKELNMQVNEELIADLTQKGWLEIESLQSRLDFLSSGDKKTFLIKQALKNLQTQYYVFVGVLESLSDTEENLSPPSEDLEGCQESGKNRYPEQSSSKLKSELVDSSSEIENFEPFEYFVDFDEPVGPAITDEDLYQN